MFGYVKPRHADLRVREYDFYRAAYCGVCRRMKKLTGAISTCSLSYDFVFLALCRLPLTDGRVSCKKCKCVAHPCKGKNALGDNAALDDTAKLAAVLSYEKIADDARDERGGKRLLAKCALPFFRRALRRAGLPELSAKVRELLTGLSLLEKEKAPSIDAPADVFGKVLGAVFSEGIAQELAGVYYDVGYHLGRFIYAIDALEDEKDDRRQKRYNPFVLLYPEGMTEEDVTIAKTGLYLTLDLLGKAIEKIPFQNADAVKEIVYNTVYLGLPDRLENVLSSRNETKKERKKRKKTERKQGLT